MLIMNHYLATIISGMNLGMHIIGFRRTIGSKDHISTSVMIIGIILLIWKPSAIAEALNFVYSH